MYSLMGPFSYLLTISWARREALNDDVWIEVAVWPKTAAAAGAAYVGEMRFPSRNAYLALRRPWHILFARDEKSRAGIIFRDAKRFCGSQISGLFIWGF